MRLITYRTMKGSEDVFNDGEKFDKRFIVYMFVFYILLIVGVFLPISW